MRKKRELLFHLAIKSVFLLTAILAGFSCLAAEKSNSRPDQSQPAHYTCVIGHRGAAGLAPENTLAAFNKACEIGVNAVELDVLLTKDRKIVVHHDYTLKPDIARTPDGKWLTGDTPAINTVTLKQLKVYDVGRLKSGTRYAKRYPAQKPTDGERIPTLDEVIELLKNNCIRAIELWIEIKTNPEKPALTPPPETVADAVLQVVRKQGVAGRTRILSFDWRALVHVQKIAPDIPTVYLSIVGVRLNNIKPGQPGASPWMAGLDIDDFSGSVPRAVRAAGGRYWAPYYNHLSYRRIQEAHGLGLQVFAWTPDTRSQLQLLIEKQVDGIITNRPDILKDILREE
ncbi:MAG: glycerophosphodiester phosphodiesterase [Desulfobacterales bacterium]